MSDPDLRHLVPGTMDHYFMASLRMWGYLPRISRPYRLKPWQVIHCALHRVDAACVYLVKHYYSEGSQDSRRTPPAVTSRVS